MEKDQNPMSEDAIKCNNCGATESSEFEKNECEDEINLTHNSEIIDVEKNQETHAQHSKKKKKITIIAIGIVALLIAASIIACLFVFAFNRKPKLEYVLYIKERELYMASLKDDSIINKITSNMVAGEDEIATAAFVNSISVLSRLINISDDCRYLFYFKDSDNEYGVNLYYKETNNLSESGEKIDSNVSTYTVNEESTVVTYLKNSEDSIFQYNLLDGTKDKISNNSEAAYVSKDGKIVIYQNDESNIYYYTKNSKEKLAGDAKLLYVTTDFKTVYYCVEDDLYKHVIGNEGGKVVSEISNICEIYDSGEIYYLKATEGVHGSQVWYYSLFYFNGTESVKLTDYLLAYSCAQNTPVIIYTEIDSESMENAKTVNLPEDIGGTILIPDETKNNTCVAQKNNISVVSNENVSMNYCNFSDAGSIIYYIDNLSENKNGDLYRISLLENGVSEAELVDKDVYYRFYQNMDEKLVYFKNYNSDNYSGDLYINGELIDSDCKANYSSLAIDNGQLYYYSDWNSSKLIGALNVYDGKSSKLISDDVSDFIVVDNKIIYLYDYSAKYYAGELYVMEENKKRKLDEDVISIVRPFDKHDINLNANY